MIAHLLASPKKKKVKDFFYHQVSQGMQYKATKE